MREQRDEWESLSLTYVCWFVNTKFVSARWIKSPIEKSLGTKLIILRYKFTVH